MREVDRENEVNRILGAFKLNPFEMLGLRFDAAPEEIPRAYRKVSLAVHPDKCSHPRAKDAFETIGHAQKELLDEEKRRSLDFLLGVARDEVRKEWKKAAKHDAAARMAALIDVDGREGVVAAYESTPEFHEAWKAKARDVLAKTEWRRRKMSKRVSRFLFQILDKS
jgi:DnaJ family protein C protein 8